MAEHDEAKVAKMIAAMKAAHLDHHTKTMNSFQTLQEAMQGKGQGPQQGPPDQAAPSGMSPLGGGAR